jgi:hypothetical protein
VGIIAFLLEFEGASDFLFISLAAKLQGPRPRSQEKQKIKHPISEEGEEDGPDYL